LPCHEECRRIASTRLGWPARSARAADTRGKIFVSRDKSEIEVPSWRDDMDLLYDDEKSEGAQTLDDSRKHLQDFADARSDKYLSVKRMIRMGHKLLADNPGLHFKDTADWVPYLIMVRKWCEASEQES
jgi:hypothetical protein